MTGGYKQYKGQLQTFDGSATGEPVVQMAMDYNSAGMPTFVGESKYGNNPKQNNWYISQYQYDAFLNITGVLTAINKCITNATNVTVDTSSNPGFARVQLVGGDLSLVSAGDSLFLKTASNFIGGTRISQILSPTEVLVAVPAVNETNTPVTDQTSITFCLEDDSLKNFDKRRWDKRALYIYS